MKRVTRNVSLDNVQDLLVRVPRACVCFAVENVPAVYPVRMLWIEGRYLFGLPVDEGNQPSNDQECVLLVDEGIYYFDLRAIYIRGKVQAVEAPSDDGFLLKWFEVVPLKIVAWDYGMLREVKDEN